MEFTDRIMIPAEKYVTADEYHAVLVSKVLVLQKYWRRWLAQRRVKQLVAFVQVDYRTKDLFLSN
jgi:hypothetical protein